MDNLYNLNIERAVLSAVLFDPYDDGIQSILSMMVPEHFYLPFHQRFYSTVVNLIRDSKPVDEEFIRERMLKDGVFDEVHMVDILSSNPVTNVKAYAAELLEYAQRREMVTTATAIKKMVFEDEESAEKVIDATLRRVEAIAEGGTVRVRRKSMAYAEARDPEFVCTPWLPFPRGTTSMVVAPGGTGKTWFALQLAIRAVREDAARRVFLWLSEDQEGIVKSRYDAIIKDVLIGGRGQEDSRIDISTEDPMLLLETHGRTASLSPRFYTMRRELREYDVIVIDPLLAFYGGDENDNSQARVFMQPFLNWARSENKVIIFLHHAKKGEAGTASKARGAGAIVDAVRCVYDMDKIYMTQSGEKKIDPHNLHMRRFTLTKDNYGAVKHLDGFTPDREIVPAKSAPTVVIEEYTGGNFDMPEIG